MAIIKIEISNPAYETENLRQLSVHSTYLKGRGDITVFVPPQTTNLTHLPITVLLHGVYGSHWVWTQQMNVHNTVLDLINAGQIPPMILVMPSDGLWGDGSAYLSHSGYNFEKWIVEDVINAVIHQIPQASKQSSKFIAGLSMGGYGALRIGSKYNTIFKAFSGHSSITDLNQMSLFVEEDISIYHQENKDESVLKYLIANENNLSPFRFDCGKDDLLIEFNRKLHQQLNKKNLLHCYEEYEGAHDAQYWKKNIVETLRFFGLYL